MDAARPSYERPARRSAARRVRATRKVYARRRAAALVAAMAVIGAIVFGAYSLATRDTGDFEAFAGSGAMALTGITIPVNLPPEQLVVETHPEGAALAVTLQDGTTMTGTTPFAAPVPGGLIQIAVTKDGYNTAVREVKLDRAQSLEVWLDPEGLLHESVVRFKCGPQPKQVAFSPDGAELWVSLLGGKGLQVFDPLTGEKLGQVDMGGKEAVELIFTRDGSTVYASQMSTSTIWEIDRAARKVTRHFKAGGSWTKVLALSPDEKTLYASNWVSDSISEIDLVAGKFVRRLNTVTTPRGLYITPDGRRLFVAGFENGDIQRIDLATGDKKTLIKTGGAMRHMVGDDAKGLLYAGDFSTNEIYVVDLATEQVTVLGDTDARPNTIDLTPDGKVLYISNRGKDNPKSYFIPGPEWGSVLAMDASTGRILDAIVGGNQCTGLDVSPDGTLLAFSDFLDDTIRVYRIPPYETLATGDGGRFDEHLVEIKKD
jgi:DNA-binding beta-propeller fold protein YncE